jgi:peptidoglycan/LPS O-acetylase OafA/YrhL
MPRNLSLDGLRGVAVFMVLLLHHNYLNVGWMGVDVFFALSGFLITSILRRMREDEHYWAQFWIKRGTRILPPLVLTIALVPVFRLHSSAGQLAAYALSLGDYLTYARPHYETLAPLWSLAVEEHFYLAWPFAVRFMNRRSLLHLIGALLLLESILRAAVSIHHRSFSLVYYTTPFRLDGLLFGSLLAVLFESPSKKEVIGRFSASIAVALAAVYIGMRVGLGLRFTKDANSGMLYNLAAYPLVALGCAALLAYVLTHGESVCVRLLSFGPVVFLGSISYGVYLYQVPIKQIVTRATGLTNRHAFFVDLPLTIFFSWMSFKFYERPFVIWGKKRAQALPKSVEPRAHDRLCEEQGVRVE